MILSYEQALDYMESLGSFGMMLGLTRIEYLLEELGHPEENLPIIHIAGTNGKGSVGAILSSILQDAGYHVGRFISPAVFDYCERIQLDDRYIDKDSFAEMTAQIVCACERLHAKGIEQPTQFEADTAMAFLYFKKMQCDFCLVEVGLGGRMDSTNVIKTSLMSIITPIGLDHTKILGNSLREIAGEKAGIIKKNQPVIVGRQLSEAMETIKDVCNEKNAHLFEISEIWCHGTGMEQVFDFENFKNLKVNLLGLYQMENAAIAIKAALVLNDTKMAIITKEHIVCGLRHVHWPGRFEVVVKEPTIIVDGAHNPDGASVLVKSLKAYFGDRNMILIMGVFADKDYPKILEIMSEVSDTLIVHKPPVQRGLDGKLLASVADRFFENVSVCNDLEEAVDLAKKKSEKNDVIISFGSLSTIGKLKEIC